MSVDILFSHKGLESVDESIDHLEHCGVWKCFDERAISFINKFSSMLLKYPGINKNPDLVALAYWFRRSSLQNLKEQYVDNKNIIRIGRGISLHVAPSNVDTIFVYSFFLSLLAGNTSFIRVSQNESAQLDIIIKIFQQIYDSGEVETAGRFVICTYPHESNATKKVSQNCELRVIWGGDETVNTIAAIPLKPSALELKFPNRSSFSVINLNALEETDDKELFKLCTNFYSDINLFGQQACSSPLAIYFVGPDNKHSQSKRFWRSFNKAATNYNLSSSEVMDRFVGASSMAISSMITKSNISFGSKDIVVLNGDLYSEFSFRHNHPGNGLLIQYFLPQINDLAKYILPEDQTLSIFGFSLSDVNEMLSLIGNRGIDRVVPIGQALDFNHIWDGIDLLDLMGRKVDISKLKG